MRAPLGFRNYRLPEGGSLQLRAGCWRDQYMNYPTQPHDQNKTKIDHAFFKKKAISERFLMEKSVE